MAFLTKTLLVCLSLICVSQALSHHYPGMGMGRPGMGMGRPGMGMVPPGMGMGYPPMGMPYGMYNEPADGSSSATPQEGVTEDVYEPEGAEVHDPQVPQRRNEEDENPELVR